MKFQKILPNPLYGSRNNRDRIILIQTKNEKVTQMELEKDSDRIFRVIQFVNTKDGDMQSVAKHFAYLQHNDVNRGVYVS